MVNPLHPVRYSKGKQNKGKIKNLTTTWGEFIILMSSAKRVDVTFNEYEKLNQDDRAVLKNANGFWFAAHGSDGKRRLPNLQPRDIMTLDVDKADRALPDLLEFGTTGISHWEFISHPTMSSSTRKPRLRIIAPMSKIVPVEDFPAASRIFAWYLDPALRQTDVVSFRPAQMMFMPAVTKDAPYELFHNKGDFLDPYAMMEAWGLQLHGDKDAWRDWSKLPRAEEEDELRKAQKKAEVPTEKRGIVGAFCRAYDVESAMAEFIPDVYAPGETYTGSKPRYTFTAGSGSNGVVVEDGGLFIYSNHGTDPCGDRLCNAFDMVRLHLYGDLDDAETDKDKPGSSPSFKAMQKLAMDDKAVMAELMADRIDLAEQFDDADVEVEEAGADEPEDEATRAVQAEIKADPTIAALIGDTLPADVLELIDGSPKPPKDWLTSLEVTEDGQIKATLPNVATIIQNDARTFGAIAYNEFTAQIVARKDILSRSPIIPPVRVRDKIGGDLWTDINDVTIRAILESPAGKKKPGYGFKVSDRDLQGGVMLASMMNKYHPIREFLNKLTWDGTPRLDSLLVRYLGCPDTKYHRDIIRISLIAAVTRIFEPGHKFDYAIIFEGFQGLGKSTFIRSLAMGRWFSELHGDMSESQKMVEQMMGYWILEIPELAGIYRSEIVDAKAFISRTTDVVRLAYARRPMDYQRQCIFMGSTNDEKYLKDPTGNRRFWPAKVTVSTIDIRALIHEMPQVWAEALEGYKAMRKAQPAGTLPLFLTDRDASREALVKQDWARQESSEEVRAGTYEAWLDQEVPLSTIDPDRMEFDKDTMVVRSRVCGALIYREFEERKGNPSPADVQHIGKALRLLEGWVPATGTGRVRHPVYGQQRWLYRKEATEQERYLGYMTSLI